MKTTPEIVFVKNMKQGDMFIKKGYPDELNRLRDNIYKYVQRTNKDRNAWNYKMFHMTKTNDGLRVERTF